MQQCIKILFYIYLKFSMFRATLIRSLKLHWQPLVLQSASSNYTSNNPLLMQNQRLPVQF